jgi:hypothetical protein
MAQLKYSPGTYQAKGLGIITILGDSGEDGRIPVRYSGGLDARVPPSKLAGATPVVYFGKDMFGPGRRRP